MSTFGQQILSFLEAQGPVLVVLIYSYLNGKIIRAEQATKTLELQNAISAAHAKIDAANAGKSSADIILSAAGPTGSKLNS